MLRLYPQAPPGDRETDMSEQVEYSTDIIDLRCSPEEMVNTVTHGIGCALAVLGMLVIMPPLLMSGAWQQAIGAFAFCSTMIAVYAASTLSHGVTEPRMRRIYRIWDQGLIYLLIAGSYTPFTLQFVDGPWKMGLLVLVWGIAIAGFLSKIVFTHRIYGVSVVVYVLLGWIGAMPGANIFAQFPAGAFYLVLGGGVCYSAGVAFLLIDKKSLHFHAIWHVCVMGGSACHFAAVYLYVTP